MAEMVEEPVLSSEDSESEEDDFSHSSSCLSLHYSSSPFEGDDSSADQDVDSQRSVMPYSYEPERENVSDSETGASSNDDSQREERLLNNEW